MNRSLSWMMWIGHALLLMTLIAISSSIAISGKSTVSNVWTTVINPSSGEKLYMSDFYLTYLRYGKAVFRRLLAAEDYANIDVFLTDDSIYLSSLSYDHMSGHSSVLRRLSKNGQVLWTAKGDGLEVIQKFGEGA